MDTSAQPLYSDILKATRSFNIDKLNEYQQWYIEAVNELMSKDKLSFTEKAELKQYRYQITRIQGDMTRILNIKSKKQLERDKTKAALNVLKASAALQVAVASANGLQIRNNVNPGRKRKLTDAEQLRIARDEVLSQFMIKHNLTDVSVGEKMLADSIAEWNKEEEKIDNKQEHLDEGSMLKILTDPVYADSMMNQVIKTDKKANTLRECKECTAILMPNEGVVCLNCEQMALEKLRIQKPTEWEKGV